MSKSITIDVDDAAYPELDSDALIEGVLNGTVKYKLIEAKQPIKFKGVVFCVSMEGNDFIEIGFKISDPGNIGTAKFPTGVCRVEIT